MPVVEAADDPCHPAIAAERRRRRREQIPDDRLCVDAVLIPAERASNLVLQPPAMLGESLVLHVLQHLLELWPAAVLGRNQACATASGELPLDVRMGLSGPM